MLYTFASLSVPAFQDVYLGTAASLIQLWGYCIPASNLDTKKTHSNLYSGAFAVLSMSYQYTIYCLYTQYTFKPYVAGTQNAKSTSNVALCIPGAAVGPTAFNASDP